MNHNVRVTGLQDVTSTYRKGMEFCLGITYKERGMNFAKRIILHKSKKTETQNFLIGRNAGILLIKMNEIYVICTKHWFNP